MASPPSESPEVPGKTKSPVLPPINTNPPRRTSSDRPTSNTQRRVSGYSTSSRSQQPLSRPLSHVFPAFHSTLSYTFVRDFAYLPNHPLHYGSQPEASGVATPASERSRRLSDPEILGWEDSRNQWSATAPWVSESTYSSNKDQLPAMTFNDGGPPYSEDEDLRSPVVTTSRHRKKQSNAGERGRSPGGAGLDRGTLVDINGDQSEEYRPIDDALDGPGGEVETYPDQRRQPNHRDSNSAKPIQRLRSPYGYKEPVSEEDASEEDEDMSDARYSRDYSFTIASPDEEMHGKAVALFDFLPEHENELRLSEGQVILVSYRHGQGWLVAEDPQSGESGLVPEEFVRLVKHIEGGLNGLQSMDIDEDVDEVVITDEPASTTTPTPPSHEFGNARSGNTINTSTEKHPAVQSNFSTSSRDFSPLKREGGGFSPDKD